MTNKNGSGAAPTPPRKRKGKGIVIEEPQPQPQPQPQPPPLSLPPPPPPPPANQNNTPLFNNTSNPQPQNIFSYYPPPNVGQSSTSQVQRILNAAAPVRPFSFTSLLTAPYSQVEDHYHNFVHHAQINQIIGLHSENLKHSLAGVLENHQKMADERAAKKLKEKEVELQVKCSQNAELESMIELYKRDATDAQYRIMRLEQTVNSLRTELRDVMDSIAVESSEEEEESSEEPNRVGMVRLECKVCERQVANMMMWPCRHICVCVQCDVVTNACPVCGSVKSSSVRVLLPSN